MTNPIPRLLALAALVVALLPTLSAADEDVRISWTRPAPAAELARPVQVDVIAEWTQNRWAPTVGAGIEPGYDVAAAPYSVPPREHWFLDTSDRFPQRMRRAIDRELRAVGLWAGPDPHLADPAEVTVRVTRFRCRDPYTRSQRCVASGTMRVGMALLPDVAVVVGADEEAPFDALAERFSRAVATRIASVGAALGTVRPSPLATLRRLPDGRWGQAHAAREGAVCAWSDDYAELIPGELGDEEASVRVVDGHRSWAVHPVHGPVTVVLRAEDARYGLTTDDRLVRLPKGAPNGVVSDEISDQACRQIVEDGLAVKEAAEKARRLAEEAQERRKAREVARAQKIAEQAAAREAADAAEAAAVAAGTQSVDSGPVDSVPARLEDHADRRPHWSLNHDEFPYRSRAKDIRAARIEMTAQGSRTGIRVLVAVDTDTELDAVLRFNPKGASWLETRFLRIAPGVYEATALVRNGTTVVQVTGRAGRSRGPLLFPKPLELERL